MHPKFYQKDSKLFGQIKYAKYVRFSYNITSILIFFLSKKKKIHQELFNPSNSILQKENKISIYLFDFIK